MELSRTSLYGKLNSQSYASIEKATAYCKIRKNPDVELLHWIQIILDIKNCDFSNIISYFNLDVVALSLDLAKGLERLPTNEAGRIDLSPNIDLAVERGWVYSTLMFGDSSVRTGYLIVGILNTDSLKSVIYNLSKEFTKIDIDLVTDNFDNIVIHSIEKMSKARDGTSISISPNMQNKEIFISYRRNESRCAAGRIFDKLIDEFSAVKIFKDIESIPLGKNYKDEIFGQVKSAKIMLVLIGPTWLTSKDENGIQRIFDEKDFVHIEIKLALKNNINIIPILIDNANMPSDESLPPALRQLASIQGFQLRWDPDFHKDMKKLISSCHKFL